MDPTPVHYNPLVPLVGDIGGTKTPVGLFERVLRRPQLVAVYAYRTDDFSSFGEILETFTRDVGIPIDIDAAAAGVAGSVVGGTARLTHVEWNVSISGIAAQLNTPRVGLLNDLEALALGAARDDGNAVVIASGTGLGQAYLHRVNGRMRPFPSEGGNAEFSTRTDREIELVRMLHRLYGRTSVEHVLSGLGLLNLHRFSHGRQDCSASRDLDGINAPTRCHGRRWMGTAWPTEKRCRFSSRRMAPKRATWRYAESRRQAYSSVEGSRQEFCRR